MKRVVVTVSYRKGTLKDNGQRFVRSIILNLCFVFLGENMALYSLRWVAWVGASCCVLSGCSWLPLSQAESAADRTDATSIATPETATPPNPDTTPVADTPVAAQSTASSAATQQPNYFSEGVTRAESAVAIGQSAQSPDDWQLAASRWQQAARYMQQVPQSDPNYSTAQQKAQEYAQHLAIAEKRAAGESIAAAQPAAPDRPPGLVATIPIVDSMGGTPVVPVTLTGDRSSQQFNMLFDTGASGTLITPAMADAIGVVITGSAVVTVADGRQVEIPVGYVDTLQVGDLIIRDLWVGIGGDVALLGQDVYGEYGLSIGSSQIDLYD